MACAEHEEAVFPEIEPRLFSFNSPQGACPECEGLGTKKEIDPNLIIPDKTRTIAEGAIMPWSYKPNNYQGSILRSVTNYYRIPDNVRFRDLTDRQQELLVNGDDPADEIPVRFHSKTGSIWKWEIEWKGVVGFLRSETSLIQTIGRAARNISGRVILYADHITGSMKRAIDETNRRRATQTAFNKKHHITPKTIQKKIESIVDHELKPEIPREFVKLESLEDIAGYIKQKEAEMKTAARNMEFEKAAVIRDEIVQLRKLQIG